MNVERNLAKFYSIKDIFGDEDEGLDDLVDGTISSELQKFRDDLA